MSLTKTKCCVKCGKDKPLSEYRYSTRTLDLVGRCSTCEERDLINKEKREREEARKGHCYTKHSHGCVHCKLFEHEFTTHCPKTTLGYSTVQLIKDQIVDFVDGEWVMGEIDATNQKEKD